MTSLQNAPSVGTGPRGWKRPPCMTQAPRQSTAMEHARVQVERVSQAQRSSSVAAAPRLPSTLSTSSASSHSLVSWISGCAGVSLSQTMPCRIRVMAKVPATRSARDWTGSMSVRTRLTSAMRFEASSARARRPTTAGAMRICVSKRAKGSREPASVASASSGSSSSKHCSALGAGTATAGGGRGREAPSLAATCETQARSAARSKARGSVDQSTSSPPPGSGLTTTDSVSSGKTLRGSAPSGKALRPLRDAQ
mmetsp:Transcript_102569/g.330957  ORF Transcript_102569/g.330957 Transcript_102569/m.330957 type:complete len:253 (-) Transcript_102569:523-1281(-)